MMSIAFSILPPFAFHPLLAQTTTLPHANSQRSAAVWMFILIASLLIFFLIIITIGLTARMMRRAKASSDSTKHHESNTNANQPDPWQEAGRRLNNQTDDLP